MVTYIFIPYMTWILYLAIMNLKRAKDAGTISHGALVLGYPLLVIGLVLDFMTMLLACIPLLDLPREPLLTSKLKRLIREGGWRGRWSIFICSKLLDQFDPSGRHCGKLY